MGRVLQLISHLEEGGAQRQLSYVLSFGTRHEYEIAVLIASPPEKLFPFFREPKVSVHFLSDTNDFYAPEILPKLQKLLSNGRYDLIHCWLFESIVQGVIAARIKKLACLAAPQTILRALEVTGIRNWEKWLIRKTLRLSDLIVFPSYTAASEFLAAGWVEAARTRAVQNGVDCDHFQPSSPGDAIVSVGRLSTEKQFGETQQLLNDLQMSFPDLRCIVVGGGKQPSSQNIEFVGFLDDIRTVLAKGMIYVSTSKIEGLSNALLEAQAMGLPCVVRRDGFNSEVVEHGFNGYLAGTLTEYVEACRLLLTDPSLRYEMGRRARAKMMSDFAVANQIAKMEDVYDELI